jgi:hypothetical protein
MGFIPECRFENPPLVKPRILFECALGQRAGGVIALTLHLISINTLEEADDGVSGSAEFCRHFHGGARHHRYPIRGSIPR